jgi:hypothetical protein
MAEWVRGKSIEGRTRPVLPRRSISLVRQVLKCGNTPTGAEVWKSAMARIHGNLS